MIKRIRVVIAEKTSGISANSIRIAGMIFLSGFAMLFLIMGIHLAKSGLHLKSDLTSAAARGYDQIAQGVSLLHSKDFDHARAMFESARETFSSIQNNTWFASGSLGSSRVEDPMFTAGNAVIEGGKALATAGSLFAESGNNLAFIPKHFFEENRTQYNPATDISLTEELKRELPTLEKSIAELKKASDEIQKIPEVFVPENVREKFMFARDALATSSSLLTGIFQEMSGILQMLGDGAPHRFLVLLQNNDELRPTGGFIGNFVLMETNNGYITKLEVIDIYEADHKLTEIITPPAEILPVNERFFMRDSNYSMDFPTSAKKSLEFLQKEMAVSADTVIAINTSFIHDLLDITGPIKIPSLKLPLRSTNFNQIISYIVESKLSGREDPKAILREFMPEFQRILFANIDPIEMMPALSRAIEQKNLIAYSTKKDVQDFIRSHEFAGEMLQTPRDEDYLAIAHTSIGGNKSDAYMEEIIAHDTYINKDGSIENEITITRTHAWSYVTENHLKALLRTFGFTNVSQNVWDILGRSTNKHALRIYVPKGSTLVSSSDNTVTTLLDPDTQKTYFSARMEVPVAQVRTLKIRYKLPYALDLTPAAKYTLRVQNQPGQRNATLIKRLLPESGIFNYAVSPTEGIFDTDGIWKLSAPFDHDMTFVSAWGK